MRASLSPIEKDKKNIPAHCKYKPPNGKLHIQIILKVIETQLLANKWRNSD